MDDLLCQGQQSRDRRTGMCSGTYWATEALAERGLSPLTFFPSQISGGYITRLMDGLRQSYVLSIHLTYSAFHTTLCFNIVHHHLPRILVVWVGECLACVQRSARLTLLSCARTMRVLGKILMGIPCDD